MAGLLVARGLGPSVEAAGAPGSRRAPLARSRTTVMKLSTLFAVDAFAGGFVVATFIVYWFQRRFGASPELLSVVMFAGGLLQAGSSIVAARVGARFGLLRTMVGTHLPSNVLLMLIPLMPSLGLAIAVLLLRFTLSQMDVPTRQAYVSAMVEPQERTAAAAFTNTARYVARPFGPAIGAALVTGFGLGAPFVAAGALKSAYDLALWRVFRRVPLPHDGGEGAHPAAGSATMNRAPPPARLAASSRPPCASTSSAATARPMPLPSVARPTRPR